MFKSERRGDGKNTSENEGEGEGEGEIEGRGEGAGLIEWTDIRVRISVRTI